MEYGATVAFHALPLKNGFHCMYKMTLLLSPEVFSKKHASADKYGQKNPSCLCVWYTIGELTLGW